MHGTSSGREMKHIWTCGVSIRVDGDYASIDRVAHVFESGGVCCPMNHPRKSWCHLEYRHCVSSLQPRIPVWSVIRCIERDPKGLSWVCSRHYHGHMTHINCWRRQPLSFLCHRSTTLPHTTSSLCIRSLQYVFVMRAIFRSIQECKPSLISSAPLLTHHSVVQKARHGIGRRGFVRTRTACLISSSGARASTRRCVTVKNPIHHPSISFMSYFLPHARP